MKKSCGYSIKLNYFSVYFNGENYIYEWPSELSDDSKKIIETTLYRGNRLLINYPNEKHVDFLGGNVYFYIFEEGAVLFKLIDICCSSCITNEIEGVFISKKYVETAWFFINELVGFLHSKEFYDYQSDGIIYEDDLLKVYNRDKTSKKLLNNENADIPYSFAISIFNPGIDGVTYIPINDKYGQELKEYEKVVDVPEKILINRNVFDGNDSSEFYQHLSIKRNKKIKYKLFRGGKKIKESYSTWVGVNNKTGIEIELKNLDDENGENVYFVIREVLSIF